MGVLKYTRKRKLKRTPHMSIKDTSLNFMLIFYVVQCVLWWKAQPNNKSQSKNDDEKDHFKVDVNRPSICVCSVFILV